MHEDELFRPIERKRTEENRLDDAEHRAARADSKREREHYETRGAATSPHGAHAELEVLPKHLDRRPWTFGDRHQAGWSAPSAQPARNGDAYEASELAGDLTPTFGSSARVTDAVGERGNEIVADPRPEPGRQ